MKQQWSVHLWHGFDMQLHLLLALSTNHNCTLPTFSIIVKGSCFKKICIEEEGAQWNVYQLALIADAITKKNNNSKFS